MRSTLRAAAAVARPAGRARGCACAPKCWRAPGRPWSTARPTWRSASASAPSPPPTGVAVEPLGEMAFVYAVAPHHPLALHEGPIDDAVLVHHRAVAVADSAQRLSPRTVNLLPGQEVLTVNSMADKIELQRRGLGSGFVPLHLAQPLLDRGELLRKATRRESLQARMGYAWRCAMGAKGERRPPSGLALRWWLEQLGSATTRRALLDCNG
jgi:DNA-binding transcriptional LysR family regulator